MRAVCVPIGSPPRMRGKAGTSCGNPESKRITPAYAGKSAQLEGASPLAQDHPRVCGEKQASTGARHTDRRITPAYAGKRVKISLKFRASEDHPRVCGEKFQRSIRLPVRSGSPPRMRGKGVRHLCEMLFTGITPAYAGKSFLIYFFARYIQDHPRVCGEKELRQAIAVQHIGSPPRMRGKVAMFCRAVRAHRITPAYAGKREQAQ